MAWHNTKRSVVNAFFPPSAKEIFSCFFYSPTPARTHSQHERRVPWSVEKCSKRCLRSIGILSRFAIFFFGWDCLPRAFFASLLFDERHNRRLRCWVWGWESFFHETHRDESMREDWRKKQTVNHNFPLKLLYIFGLKNLRSRWRRMSSNISS